MVSKKKVLSECHYDTDVTAANIWLKLLEDFRTTEGQTFAASAEKAFLGGIKEFRNYQFPELGYINPYRFKMWRQLSDLLKKYRFCNDKYTDEELNVLTLDKTIEDQISFSSLLPEKKPLVHLVLQRARKHAKRILGHIDHERTVTASRFGKKSSIGCPLNLAYIDHKLTDVKAFTSSSDCCKWFFKDVLPSDGILSELVSSMGISPKLETLQHETLTLVLVPKSWKSYRPITPLTLLSLYYSYGIGEQVEDRLRDEGLDISRLQSIHAKLVRSNSVSCRLATADLSNASQSLLSVLLNCVLPREWYCAMKKTFSHSLIVRKGDEEVLTYTESVLPMGNGLTFPVETLVFYCILKAIAELSGVKGRISVYGDDLIYPSRLHKFVSVIFPLLNFKLNLDKTFVKAPFRESCGSDYYRGADVRPAFLPDEHKLLTKQHYLAWLYKCYNALIRRWPIEEIPKTGSFLLKEINALGFQISRVPPSFPDIAGVKVESPAEYPLEHNGLNWSPIVVAYYSGSRWFHFSYLVEQPYKRLVKSVKPYYWLALQGKSDDTSFIDSHGNFWETDYSYMNQLPKSSLTWKTIKQKKKYFTKGGKMHQAVLVKRLAYVTSRSGRRLSCAQTKRESISDWF